jgi:hypothetical protein
MKRLVLGCVLGAFFASGAAAAADPGAGNVNGSGPDPSASVTTAAPTLDTTVDGVQFTVSGGNLNVTGDSSGSKVKLEESGGVWKATVDTTAPAVTAKVEPTTKVQIGGVTGSVDVNLGAGNDQLIMQNGTIGDHLTIRMGEGNDRATLSALTVGTYLHFEGNAGDDSLVSKDFLVTDPTFDFFSTIDMQDGADSVSLQNFHDQDLQITLGAGKDRLAMSGSAFLGGPFQRLRIDAGDDRDTLDLQGVKTSPLFVEVGGGVGDVVSTIKCKADTATFLDSGGSNGVLLQKKDSWGSIFVDPNFV